MIVQIVQIQEIEPGLMIVQCQRAKMADSPPATGLETYFSQLTSRIMTNVLQGVMAEEGTGLHLNGSDLTENIIKAVTARALDMHREVIAKAKAEEASKGDKNAS